MFMRRKESGLGHLHVHSALLQSLEIFCHIDHQLSDSARQATNAAESRQQDQPLRSSPIPRLVGTRNNPYFIKFMNVPIRNLMSREHQTAH